MKFHYIHNEKFELVISQLQSLPPRSFVLLTTIGGFKTQDAISQTLQNSIDQLSSLQNIIIMSMEDAYIQNRVIGGYVTDGKKQGALAAQKALQILHHVPIKIIQTSTAQANTYIFNRKALYEAQLFLPDPISKNAIILNEDISFYIRYQDTIQDVFFILLILSFIFAILIYLISKEKKQELLDTQKNLLKLQKKFEKTDAVLHNIEKLSNAIYWELDIEDSKVFIINAANLELGFIDKTILSYDDFFNDFIHPNNFYLLKESIKTATQENVKIEIKHNILLQDSSSIQVINTFHNIHSSDGVKKIIGLIKAVPVDDLE